MHYVTRLSHARSAFSYPLAMNRNLQWHNASDATGQHWQLTLPLPEIPPDHLITPSYVQLTSGYRYQWTARVASTEIPLAPTPAREPFTTAARETLADTAPLTNEIDCWHSRAMVQPQLTLKVSTTSEPIDCLVVVNVRPLVLAPSLPEGTRVALTPPLAISQYIAPTETRNRICSPTALHMALSQLGHTGTWAATVAGCFDADTQAYGKWPMAMLWASKHGFVGAVELFSDWATVVELLSQEIPIVCSIRYPTGGLSGAPLQQTPGHLVLLYGIENQEVLVMDPAGKTCDNVQQRYRIEEFNKVWLCHRGAGYVIAPRQGRRSLA